MPVMLGSTPPRSPSTWRRAGPVTLAKASTERLTSRDRAALGDLPARVQGARDGERFSGSEC